MLKGILLKANAKTLIENFLLKASSFLNFLHI